MCVRERERDNDEFMCFLVVFLSLSRSRELVDPDCVSAHLCVFMVGARLLVSQLPSTLSFFKECTKRIKAKKEGECEPQYFDWLKCLDVCVSLLLSLCLSCTVMYG